MLITMKEMLEVAKEHHFAIGAFNIADSELFRCVIEEAEANNAPVIVELAPPEFDYVGEDFFAFVCRRLEKSMVPCVLHLDHGGSLEDCMKAIRCGFTSVMIDGSQLPYEENVAISKKVVEVAHAVGVSVEGEIGTIGALENSSEGGAETITYTQPEEVQDFVARTGVDSLAIAIGTAHGIYPEGFVPQLRLGLLSEIRALTNTPLVLHGGSANDDEEIRQACEIGIEKVNIASDYRRAFFTGVKETMNESDPFWSPDVFAHATAKAKAVIRHKMHLFNCIDKADLYK